MKHYSVLKSEVIHFLNLKPDGVYVDATLGYAGHSSEILKQIPKGFLYAFDRDEEAIHFSFKELTKIGTNFEIIHADFAQMKEELQKRGVMQVDGILFDLGVSSPQIDSPSRGFSFMRDENLDMRMDQSQVFSAKDLVNTYSEEALTRIFFQYGEEPRGRQIAVELVKARKKQEVKTTGELVEIIKHAVGLKYFYQKHPERTIFQAIRIEVNQELEQLKQGLPEAIFLLKKGGRMGVITFHSLEDRIVKQVFREKTKVDEMVKGLPVIPKEYLPEMKLVTLKPIVASEKELKENSRSQSAKLRVIERIKEHEKEEKTK